MKKVTWSQIHNPDSFKIEFDEIVDLTEFEYINIEGIEIFFHLEDDINKEDFQELLIKGIKNYRRYLKYQYENLEKFFSIC